MHVRITSVKFCPAQVAASPMINNQNRGIRLGIELSCPADTSELCIYQSNQTHQRCHAVSFPI